MTLIERVARAIFYSKNATGPMVTATVPGEPSHQCRLAKDVDLETWDSERERCEEMARAAITAMRAPTEAMETAYWAAESAHAATDGLPAKMAWQAMIDAALSEKTP